MSEQKQAASYQLVPMTIELIPQIAELERLCFSKPWNEQMLAEGWTTPLPPSSWLWGTTAPGAGLQQASRSSPVRATSTTWPSGEYRRQGIAQALLDVFLRFGKAHQLAFFDPGSRASNGPAKQLYMKLFGFEQVGRRKDYYDRQTRTPSS